MRKTQLDRAFAEKFASDERFAECFLHVAKRGDCILGGCDAEQCSCTVRRTREKPQHCAGDDAERAFATDKELLPIVSGVVFAQRAHSVGDRPVGEHDLQTEHESAHRAVSQYRRAAGVCCDQSTDLGGAFCGKREWKESVGALSSGLYVSQHAARVNGHREAGRIERAYATHAREAEHDRAVKTERRRTRSEAGVTALRDDRSAGIDAGAHASSERSGVARARNGKCRAGKCATPIGYIRCNVGGFGEQAARTADRGELIEHARVHACCARCASLALTRRTIASLYGVGMPVRRPNATTAPLM